MSTDGCDNVSIIIDMLVLLQKNMLVLLQKNMLVLLQNKKHVSIITKQIHVSINT